MTPAVSLFVVNANVFTADDDNPHAEAFIVEDGRISWIGAEADAPANDLPRLDLQGARVIPGFVDAHMHPVMLAEMNTQIAALPPVIHSIEELVDTVRERREADGFDPAHDWIEGWGYDEAKFAEHRSPTRWDLDRGCADAPVCILRSCAHVRCVNSRALELAGITRDTPDPDGGIIERDENGEPTGVLRENARDLVTRVMPETSTEETARELRELGDLLSSQGIVAVTDMGALDDTDNFPIIERAAELGLCQEVGVYYMWDHWMDKKDFDITPELMDRTRQVFVCGLKLIGDGSISGQTAWMDEPYLKADGTPRADDAACGLPVCSDEQTRTAIEFCKAHGCQLSLHAMGNRAIERMLDFVEDEAPWTEGEAPYLRFEHVTLPSERSIERVVAKGIGIASQPIFPYAEIEAYLGNLGHARTRRCYPYRTLLDDGVNLCFSTDAPATSWAVPSDPFPCIKGAVTRHAYEDTDFGEDEAVDVETAITLYTREAARMAGFEGLGMLKPGMKASFAVLDRDIFSIPADEIDRVQVLATYVRGTCVYQREA